MLSMRTFLSAKEAITETETEGKLNKARLPFWNEVSLNVGADFS